MENQGKKDGSRILFLEKGILGIGVVLSFLGTIEPIRYDLKYAWCFLFPALGVLLIILIRQIARKSKTAGRIFGLIAIIVYLVIAGLGYGYCLQVREGLRLLDPYRDKSVTVMIGETQYRWDNRSFIRQRGGLTQIEDGKVRLFIDGNQKEGYAFFTGEDEMDVIYVQVHSGGTGEWLRLVKE